MHLLLRVAPLLLLSGGCALIYQTVWFRELRLIFGSSTFASSAVLGIFMGGLGLGAALFGRRADRHPRPLALYGKLEIVAALAAALSPLLAALVREAYVAAGGLSSLGTVGATLVRLLLAALILAVPTIAMGGTLPAAARAVLAPTDVRRRNVAILYGVNTLGAVLGTLLATFSLIESIGTRGTLWVAAALNLVVGGVAVWLARGQAALGEEPPAPAAPDSSAEVPPERFVLGAAALVGFVFFAMELVWYRMLAPLLGGSTYSFGGILAVALAGIGLGGAAYAAFGQDRPATARGFALTCGLEALFLALPFALGDRIALLAWWLQGLKLFGFGGLVSAWMLVSALVVFLPAFVAGVQFPLLIGLLGRGRAGAGRQIGLAYALNTGGSIVGALIGGFVLLPAAGALPSWRALVAVLVALSLGAIFLQARRLDRRVLVPAVIGLLSVGLLLAPGPSAAWRHSGIGAGRAQMAFEPNGVRDWANVTRRHLIWEDDGRESSVALVATDDLAFVVNGKTDGSALTDAATQVMSGLLGALLNPDAKRAMVIGLGTGSTAGWLGAVPHLEQVDVVEIEPSIVEMARHYAKVNENVLDNPKVKIHVEDAREVLLTRRDRYDLLFSEPSNPYRAGIASLFTREFYAAVKERMNPGALFIQWVQAYEVDARTVQAIARTLQSEFAEVELWHTQGADLLLVARQEKTGYPVERIRKLARSSPFKEALARTWGVADAEGVFSRFIANHAFLEGLTAGNDALINTDDRNFVEFSFARTVGEARAFSAATAWTIARRAQLDLPPLDGTLSLEAVDIARARGFERLDQSQLDLPVAARQLLAIGAAAEAGDLAAAYRMLIAGVPLRHPRDLVLAAHVLASQGDIQARDVAGRIGAWDPVAPKLLEAMLQVHQSALGRATDLLVEAFTLHRDNPWAARALTREALLLAGQIARMDKPLGRRLYEALEEPFAAHHLETGRIHTRLDLAMVVDPRGLCVEALSAYEPHVRWDRAFLARRAGCYVDTGHPLAAAARADLERFEAVMPRAVSDLIGIAPARGVPVAAERP